MSFQPQLTPSTCNSGLFNTHFTMVNLRLGDIKERMAAGKTPFKQLIMCHMGNPAGVGQKPITFCRELICACMCPELHQYMPKDVVERAKRILADCPGKSTGSYQATEGIKAVVDDIRAYIAKRDNLPLEKVDGSKIFLTNGASEGLATVQRAMIRTGLPKKDAILTPSPGFPQYNASITYMEGAEYVYQLDEDDNWGIKEKELQLAYDNAIAGNCTPRCLVIINPSNPTGSVQTKEQLLTALRFAYSHNLCVIADEVYQDNIYDPEHFPFISCYKLLHELEDKGECKGLELISVHSASKSCFGECGRRGGYWHCYNLNDEVLTQILDCYSLTCANSDGMIAMDVLVNHPKPGDESYELFNKEYNEIFLSLQRKAKMISEELNSWEGMSCVTPTGAMYVYPRMEIGKKGVEAAKAKGLHPDEFYCNELMNEVGVVTLPGYMFGQREGTYHLRSTILLSEEVSKKLLVDWKAFHQKFYQMYKD